MKCAHVSSIVTEAKTNFPLTLMVYHRKISTLIKKQNAMAYWASIKDSIQLKITFKNVISNSVLIIEAKS